ncbi:MAG TPA: hypothetical protein PKJ97_00030 [Candidatus Bilamarchaeaceae archaeon]|nr:hypothetical protein [Candidatus Bilamarchaeaceae archaeon]
MIWILILNAAKLFLGLFAISLIYFAITPGQTLFDLLKYTALSAGVSMLFVLLYPRVKKVRKGDPVQISGAPFPFHFMGFGAIADSDASIREKIKVKLGKGRVAIGIVESYEGLLSPPRIRIVFEEMVK